MAVRTSAGILLFRRVGGRLEVLLAHPGGPWFANKDLGAWTIPKGAVTEAEQADGDGGLLAAARREFQEETGHRPPDDPPPIELGSITQKSGKVVWAWAIEGDMDPAMAFSNTFQARWPPRAPRTVEVPEIDRVAWYAPAQARRRIIPAQAELIDRLEAALASRAAGSTRPSNPRERPGFPEPRESGPVRASEPSGAESSGAPEPGGAERSRAPQAEPRR